MGARSSAVMGPARRSCRAPSCGATTVDSRPSEQGPPSRMSGMRPSSSSRTCAAAVGEMRPKRFALGAATGVAETGENGAEERMRAHAYGDRGQAGGYDIRDDGAAGEDEGERAPARSAG